MPPLSKSAAAAAAATKSLSSLSCFSNASSLLLGFLQVTHRSSEPAPVRQERTHSPAQAQKATKSSSFPSPISVRNNKDYRESWLLEYGSLAMLATATALLIWAKPDKGGSYLRWKIGSEGSSQAAHPLLLFLCLAISSLYSLMRP